MAPKKKGTILTLQELNSFVALKGNELPTFSSGAERPQQDRSDGDWGRDRLSMRDERNAKADELAAVADADDDWRGSSGPARGAPRNAQRGDTDFASVRSSVRARVVDTRRDEDVDFSMIRRGPATPSSSNSTPVPAAATGTSNSTGSSAWRSSRAAAVTSVANSAGPTERNSRAAAVMTVASSVAPSDRSVRAAPVASAAGSVAPTKPPRSLDALLAPTPVAELPRSTVVKEEVKPLEPQILKRTRPVGSRLGSRAGKGSLEAVLAQKEKEEEEKAKQAREREKEPTNAAKAQYRKQLQESSMKKKHDEQRRRLEIEEEQRQQRQLLESMMQGNEEKISQLEQDLENCLLSSPSGTDAQQLLSKVRTLFSPQDLRSLIPSIITAKTLYVAGLRRLEADDMSDVTDAQRMEAVALIVRCLKPALNLMFTESKIKNHKLHFLVTLQRIAVAGGLPRISPGLALIEALWDALYIEGVVEEQWFVRWFESPDEVEALCHDGGDSRNKVLFQMTPWYSWLTGSFLERVESAAEEEDEEEEDGY